MSGRPRPPEQLDKSKWLAAVIPWRRSPGSIFSRRASTAASSILMRPGCCCARPRSLGSRLWKQWKCKRGSGRNPWQINCTQRLKLIHNLVEVKLTGKYDFTVCVNWFRYLHTVYRYFVKRRCSAEYKKYVKYLKLMEQCSLRALSLNVLSVLQTLIQGFHAVVFIISC